MLQHVPPTFSPSPFHYLSVPRRQVRKHTHIHTHMLTNGIVDQIYVLSVSKLCVLKKAICQKWPFFFKLGLCWINWVFSSSSVCSLTASITFAIWQATDRLVRHLASQLMPCLSQRSTISTMACIRSFQHRWQPQRKTEPTQTNPATQNSKTKRRIKQLNNLELNTTIVIVRSELSHALETANVPVGQMPLIDILSHSLIESHVLNLSICWRGRPILQFYQFDHTN